MGSTWKGILAAGLIACSGDATDTTDATTGDSGVEQDADGDGFTRSQGDCNDNDRMVFPNAIELCDGKDNDCDVATTESGVSFQPMSGQPVDHTKAWSAGTKAKPAVIELSESGVLHVCDGTWYVTVDVSATPTGIVGHPSSSTATLVLDGGGVTNGITVSSEANFRLETVALQNYVADPKTGLGGALHCGEAGAAVQLERVNFTDNTAAVAGGSVAVVDGCTASMEMVSFTNGTAQMGAHLAISDTPENAPVQVFDATFTNGSALKGGSVAVGSEITPFRDGDSVFRCRDCTFDQNQATDPLAKKGTSEAGGGAIWLGGDALLQTQGTTFSNNTADAVGGAILLQATKFDGATAEITTTDFSGNRANNEDNDIAVPAVKTGNYTYGSDTTASCDEDTGCQTP